MDQELSRLETLLDRAQSTVETIDAQNTLSEYLLDHDLKRSYTLAISAENLAIKEEYEAGLASARKNQLHYFFFGGDHSSSLKAGNAALSIFEKLQDKTNQALVLRVLGFVHSDMGDFAKGLEYQLKVVSLFEEIGNPFQVASSITNIGIVHSMAGNSQQAVEFYNRSLSTYADPEQKSWRARTLNSCCVDYTLLGDYAKAASSGKEALETFLEIGDVFGAGVAQSSLGEVALARQDFGSAVQFFEMALTYFQRHRSDTSSQEVLETQLNLGRANLELGDTEKAIDTIQRVIAHAEKQAMQPIKMKGHQLLAQIYEKGSEPANALAHLKQYIEIREKILNEAKQREIHNLQIIHATQEALAENERQKALRNQDKEHFQRLTKIKDDFLHSATHDIKNPLSVISIATSFLRLTVPQTDTRTHEYINMISGAAQKILHLVTSILDLARLEANPTIETKPITLLPWFREILNGFKVLAEAKQLVLSVEVQPPDLVCNCNQEHFGQVVENLLSNTVKYTSEGGKVKLKAMKQDGQIQIEVVDNGIGIPNEEIPNLFDPFYRVKNNSKAAEGTGLGLSIVKLSVEQHKGTIHVKSKPGKGTTFTVFMPE